MHWLTSRKSKLSIENKLKIYKTIIKSIFFFDVKEIRTDTRPLLGGSGVVVPDSKRLKLPRWQSRLQSSEAREPVRGTPPSPKMHPLMEWYAVPLHRTSSPKPPCKAVWFPYRTVWRSRGGGAAEAADALRQGALASPRSPVGVKLRRWYIRASGPPSGRGTRLPCTAAPVTRCGVTGRHIIPLGDAFWGRGVSLAPVPGPLSIAVGTIIVEVLVGWSPALRHRLPPEAAWCPCGFPPRQKKSNELFIENIYTKLKINIRFA